jgi:hypothetical protein
MYPLTRSVNEHLAATEVRLCHGKLLCRLSKIIHIQRLRVILSYNFKKVLRCANSSLSDHLFKDFMSAISNVTELI